MSDYIDRGTIDLAIRDRYAWFNWEAFDAAICAYAKQRARALGSSAPSHGWMAYTCELVKTSSADTYLRGINRLVERGMLTESEYLSIAALIPNVETPIRVEP